MTFTYQAGNGAGRAIPVAGSELLAAGHHSGSSADVLRAVPALGAEWTAYTLCHLHRGVGWYWSPATVKRIPLAASDSLVLYPKLEHVIQLETTEPWDLSWLTMRGALLDRLCTGGALAPAQPRHAREQGRAMARKFEEFELLHQQVGEHAEIVLSSLALHMFALLNWGGGEPLAPAYQAQREIVRQAKTIIALRIEAPPSVEELAAELGMNARTFRRLFEDMEGMNPKAFIVKQRIERAKMLLTETQRTIGDIAETLGFNSPFFFARQFKWHAGMSPAAWRKEHGRPPSLAGSTPAFGIHLPSFRARPAERE